MGTVFEWVVAIVLGGWASFRASVYWAKRWIWSDATPGWQLVTVSSQQPSASGPWSLDAPLGRRQHCNPRQPRTNDGPKRKQLLAVSQSRGVQGSGRSTGCCSGGSEKEKTRNKAPAARESCVRAYLGPTRRQRRSSPTENGSRDTHTRPEERGDSCTRQWAGAVCAHGNAPRIRSARHQPRGGAAGATFRVWVG